MPDINTFIPSFGDFKNPKFISNETDETGKINITIKYDEWDEN